MIDITLLIGRILLITLLFAFLFAVMRAGIGLVRGQVRRGEHWIISAQKGPRELRGVRVVVHGPVVIGRAAGADIVVNATFVSGRHARITAVGDDLTLEDLGSTNGTLLNGERISEPTLLHEGDLIDIGDVTLRVDRS